MFPAVFASADRFAPIWVNPRHKSKIARGVAAQKTLRREGQIPREARGFFVAPKSLFGGPRLAEVRIKGWS